MNDAPPVFSASPPGRQVARISGVPVRVTSGSLLFLTLLVVLYARVLTGRSGAMGVSEWAVALLLPAVFAVSVLLHEVGHAVLGRRCGLQVRWIVLDGLGGETEFDRDAPRPLTSALVAGAGPAVSAALAVALGVTAHLMVSGTLMELLFTQAAFGNALIAMFNLLPGLPLDGGHLLRSAVWALTGSPRVGTAVSAVSGLLLAAAIIAVPAAVFLNADVRPSVITVAVFLFVAWPVASGAWTTLRELNIPHRSEA